MSPYAEQMLLRVATPNATIMRIMQRYDFHSNEVFLVVEGKDDSAYYERVARDRCDDRSRKFTTLVAGNKHSVITVHAQLDWSKHDAKRILFFIDRDFSDYDNVDSCQEPNLYVTDGYSIENSLINECSVIALARRACSGDSFLEAADEDEIRDLYRDAVAEAAKILVPITVRQILWHRAGISYRAERFEPGRYFDAEDGVLEAVLEFDGDACTIEEDFALPGDCRSFSGIEHKSITKSIGASGGYELAVRGKYRLRMLSFWMRSLSSRTLPSGALVRPGRVLQDVFAEVMAVAPTPQSLKAFIDANLVPSARGVGE